MTWSQYLVIYKFIVNVIPTFLSPNFFFHTRNSKYIAIKYIGVMYRWVECDHLYKYYRLFIILTRINKFILK